VPSKGAAVGSGCRGGENIPYLPPHLPLGECGVGPKPFPPEGTDLGESVLEGREENIDDDGEIVRCPLPRPKIPPLERKRRGEEERRKELVNW